MATPSLEGHLIISAPHLPEPFSRSVILIVRHNDEGAFGLVLNKPTTTKVKDAWSKLSELPCHTDERLRFGGPVDGPLMALHRHEFLLEIEVMPNLYFSAGRDKLERLVCSSDELVRFFVGYAGWSAGQLENEFQRGSWSALPAKPEYVFEGDDTLWLRATRAANDLKLQEILHVKHAPDNASLN
jgi:putative transcriptional regulator